MAGQRSLGRKRMQRTVPMDRDTKPWEIRWQLIAWNGLENGFKNLINPPYVNFRKEKRVSKQHFPNRRVGAGQSPKSPVSADRF